MTKVECPLDTCKFVKDGICQKDNVVFKWRCAGDFGRGSIVMMECLMLELRDRKEFLQEKE